MGRKKQLRQRRPRGESRSAAPPGRRRRKLPVNTPSLIFIGVILLIIALVAVATLFDDDAPLCPPGQVWSAAHGHCH
jgi:hypothetical protein